MGPEVLVLADLFFIAQFQSGRTMQRRRHREDVYGVYIFVMGLCTVDWVFRSTPEYIINTAVVSRGSCIPRKTSREVTL